MAPRFRHRLSAGRLLVGLLCAAALIPQSAGAALRATLEANRDTIYLYQGFQLLLTIDTEQVRIGSRIDLLALPDADVLSLGTFEELPPQRRVDGNSIRELRRYRCSARAMAAGLLDVSPVVRVRLLSRKRLFIGSTWVETPLDIRVEPLTLQVHPLPNAQRPDDFSGAVGRFSFDVEVAPTNVAPGDLVTLAMRIQGEGYLENLVPPQVRPGIRFKVYTPRVLPGAPGTACYEQVVIPQGTNAVSIAPLTFSYFDPETEHYTTLSCGPFRLAFRARQAAAYEQYRPRQAVQATDPRAEPTVFSAPPLRRGPRAAWATNSAAAAAAEAYADGYFDAAVAGYEELLAAGFASAELHANAASACLMAGKPGAAVLHYRRALRLAPRDRATLAGLAVAERLGRLTNGPDGRLARMSRTLRPGEWLGTGALLLLVGGLCLAVACRIRRRVVLVAVGLMLLAAAVAAGAFASRTAFRNRTDAVVMAKQAARFAPYASARATFSVPAGALVTVLETSGEWKKVAFSRQRGWVPAASVEPVCPPRSRAPARGENAPPAPSGSEG